MIAFCYLYFSYLMVQLIGPLKLSYTLYMEFCISLLLCVVHVSLHMYMCVYVYVPVCVCVSVCLPLPIQTHICTCCRIF